MKDLKTIASTVFSGALAGSLLFVAQAVNADQNESDVQAPATPPMEVFSSEATRINLPIIEHASDIVPINLEGGLYVIAPEDILAFDTSPELAEEMSIERALGAREITVREYDAFFKLRAEENNTSIAQAHFFPAAFNAYIDAHYPELSEYKDNELSAVARYTAMGKAGNRLITAGQRQQEPTHSIITTGYFDSARNIRLSGSSGVSAEDFESVPGNDQCWQSATFLHEMGHINTSISGEASLGKELHADQWMQEWLPLISAECDASTKEEIDGIAHAWHGLRALGAFNYSSYTHDTSVGLRAPDEDVPPISDINQMTSGLMQARSRLDTELGSTGICLQSCIDMIQRFIVIAERGNGGYTDQDISILREIVDAPETISDIWVGLSYTAIMRVHVAAPLLARTNGLFLTVSNEEKYGALQSLYLDGAFDENSLGKRYVYEYLTAAQDYAPTVHGANIDEVFVSPELVLSH